MYEKKNAFYMWTPSMSKNEKESHILKKTFDTKAEINRN